MFVKNTSRFREQCETAVLVQIRLNARASARKTKQTLENTQVFQGCCLVGLECDVWAEQYCSCLVRNTANSMPKTT